MFLTFKSVIKDFCIVIVYYGWSNLFVTSKIYIHGFSNLVDVTGDGERLSCCLAETRVTSVGAADRCACWAQETTRSAPVARTLQLLYSRAEVLRLECGFSKRLLFWESLYPLKMVSTLTTPPPCILWKSLPL